MTPEVIELIRRRWLEGQSEREIGLEIGLAQSTVQHHLNHTIKPLIRNQIQWDTGKQIDRAEHVIRLAFEGFHRSARSATKKRGKYQTVEALKKKIKGRAPKGMKLVEETLETIDRDGDRGWLELVLSAMDFMAKVKGGYAPRRINMQVETEMRVAGQTPAQIEDWAINRIATLYFEKMRHQQILATAMGATGLGGDGASAPAT
ncbi:MAG TPA: hypothetical protein VHC22_33910 [Pirellulales bacterium]|nr:hypothetical protein [Pirellulales bacterium]